MPTMQIYLARNNVQAGPYTAQQLNNMLASGEVQLNDLMWHEGMDNWQRVGNMTKETLSYPPSTTTTDIGSHVSGRPSVDRLYGKKPSASVPTPLSPTNKKTGLNKPNLHKSASEMLAPKKVGENQLAGIGSRVLAVLIDEILVIASCIPLLAAFDFDLEKLREIILNFEANVALIEALPKHLLMMSLLMLLALAIIQVAMLIKRGQSLGKLMLGVRVLDINTHQIPSVTNIILIRTLLKNLIYGMGLIGGLATVIDFIVMILDKERRSVHDKLAKTYVVKAEDRQIAYKENSLDKKAKDK